MRAPRLLAALAAAPLVVAAMAGGAMADDVANNLDGTVDAVAEVMPLNVGGTAGTTTLYVAPTNGDGKNGCNLTRQTTLTVAVTSSDPSVATVSPSSVTFDSCGAQRLLTVTPVSVGSATVSVSQTSNDSGGTFDLTTATFRVDVTAPAPANTAPVVAVAGVTEGASYAKGAVPSATCEVTDAEDGPSTFAATLSDVAGPYAADGIGSQTATCSYTDSGGLTASSSVTYSIVDPSAPVITYDLSPADPDGDNGWYTSDVTLIWHVSEPESPSSLTTHGCDPVTVSADQQAVDYTCSAESAGGTATPQTVTIQRDATAPTEPTFVGAPTDVYYGTAQPAPTCTATDDVSGVAADGCTVTLEPLGDGTPDDPDAVGTHTYLATAVNGAGLVSSSSWTWTVKAWTLKGFYAPVDMGGTWNTVKNGSTVPLKFEIFAGDTERTSTADVKGFTVKGVTCPTGGAAVDAIELTTTGGTSLRYDATAGQFVQNWQTPKRPGACYTVTMTAQDGSQTSANFQLK